ncbi:hypothetical protein B0H16DRAFT_1739180 [Mycena metata]|uniref:F-box domain-containing protein n=1 Tax=Mycena metata TaxID=1033252 RepID=A0AAD7HFX5_9AGAR|nr:hypothetical protein B0H16DRAFT_1739180 [Mycena metata]
MTRIILEAERIRAAELDAQILDLERSLSTLRAQKTMVQERLDSYKYPVLTLPNEIVSEIFVHSLPVYPECPPLTGGLSPTNLTHICRKWREVARNNPMLWRAVRLCFSTLPRQAQELDMYLDMSGCCPLSIDTERPRNVVYSPPTAHAGSTSDLTASICLTIAFLNLDTRCPSSATYTYRVTLSGCVVNAFILPSAQLTSLTLRLVYPSECTPILQQTTNLIHCRLDILTPEASEDELEADITLPCLESYRLDLGSHPDFFEILVVPALRSLEIPEECLGVNPIDTLTSFIAKSGCKPGQIFITGPRNFMRDTYRKAFPSERCLQNSRDLKISTIHYMLSHLQTYRAHAADLDAQMMDLERALSVLRAQRAVDQERLDSYKCPVLTVPNEILSEIFLHFTPPYPECPPLTGTLSPINLTHICRKWREISISYSYALEGYGILSGRHL